MFDALQAQCDLYNPYQPKAAGSYTRATLCHSDAMDDEPDLPDDGDGIEFQIAVGRNRDRTQRIWASVGGAEYTTHFMIGSPAESRHKVYRDWLERAGIEDGNVIEADGEVIVSRHLTMVRQMERAYQAELNHSRVRLARRALHVQQCDEDEQSLEVLSSWELEDSGAVEYIIPDLLPDNQSSGVFGQKGAGKTHLAVDLCVSVGSPGCRFLDLERFAVRKHNRTFMVSPESGGGLLPDIVRIVTRQKKLDFRNLDNCLWSTSPIRLDNPRTLDLLGERFRREGIGLFVADSIYRMLGSGLQAGSLFAVGQILSDVETVCRDEGVTFLFTHHTTKNRQFRPGTLNDIAWAGFTEFIRSWMFISPRSAYRPGSGIHHAYLSYGGSAGHQGLVKLDIDEGTVQGGRKWEVRIVGDGEPGGAGAGESSGVENGLVSLHADRLLAVLRNHPAGETKSKLRTAAKLTAADCDAAISHLLESGAIEQTKIRKRTGCFTAYQIVTKPSTKTPTKRATKQTKTKVGKKSEKSRKVGGEV